MGCHRDFFKCRGIVQYFPVPRNIWMLHSQIISTRMWSYLPDP